jgi:hypothetical protein
MPGDLACQWSVLNKTPHTGSIFQLLLQPVQAASQPGRLDTQQQQQQQEGEAIIQRELQTVQHIQPLQDPVQDKSHLHEQVLQTTTNQQQRQQHLQELIAGKYRVVSVSMDRCFVMSQLTIQAAAPDTAPSDGKASTDKAALLSLPVSSSSSSSRVAAQESSVERSCLALQLKGCTLQWVCQGLGGFAYSCAVQHTYPDALEPAPKYSKLRVAVGCGDKTIRVVTMGVRAAAAAAAAAGVAAAAAVSDLVQEQQQQLLLQEKERGQQEDGDSQQQDPSAFTATVAAAAAAADDALVSTAVSAVHAPAETAPPAQNGSTVVSSSVEQQPTCELQLPVPKPTLLWRNIQDRAQALAWHPTNPRKHTS